MYERLTLLEYLRKKEKNITNIILFDHVKTEFVFPVDEYLILLLKNGKH